MKTFITSDLHFCHENIIKYEHLPFIDTEEMNETIIKNWNSVVSKEDEVWVLGDVFFCSKEKAKEIMDKLNGHKYLIYGNHDNHSIQWFYDVGFDEVYKHAITLNGFIHLQHRPPEYIREDAPNIYIYGHVHNSADYKTINTHSACVCHTRWGYQPVELNKIIDMVNEYCEYSHNRVDYSEVLVGDYLLDIEYIKE